jgi:hypothetical protein
MDGVLRSAFVTRVLSNRSAAPLQGAHKIPRNMHEEGGDIARPNEDKSVHKITRWEKARGDAVCASQDS